MGVVRKILPSKKLLAYVSRCGYRPDFAILLCLGREGLSPERREINGANSPGADLGVESELSFLRQLVSLKCDTH